MTLSPALPAVVGLLLALALGACQSEPATKRAAHADQPYADKIKLSLLRLDRDVREAGLSLAETAAQRGFVVSDDGLVLDIATSRLDAHSGQAFEIPGVELYHVSPKYRRVSAAIQDLGLLYELAAIAEVRSIAPEYGARTRGASAEPGERR